MDHTDSERRPCTAPGLLASVQLSRGRHCLLQGITIVQRRPLTLASNCGDLEILHSQRQALEPLFAQHQKSLPGVPRFLTPCDGASLTDLQARAVAVPASRTKTATSNGEVCRGASIASSLRRVDTILFPDALVGGGRQEGVEIKACRKPLNRPGEQHHMHMRRVISTSSPDSTASKRAEKLAVRLGHTECSHPEAD